MTERPENENNTKPGAGCSAATCSTPVDKSRTKINTTRAVLKLIPQGWRDAELRIGSMLDEPLKIIRVSLQKDVKGRRVVMLHEKPFRDE